MKNVVFFVGSLNGFGGTERVSTIIANELSHYGYNIKFLSLHDGDNPFFYVNKAIQKDTLFPVKLSFKKHYHKVIIKLRSYIKKNDVDVLINVESMLSLYSVPACVGIDVRNICWEHFNFHVDLGLKIRGYARKLAAFACDDIITLTETDKTFWLENTRHRATITAIPNPSPFKLCEPRIQVNNKIALSAGRLMYQKGFDYLLDAWSLVIKQRQDWKLRIVGSGEEHDALKNQAEKLGLNNHIEWVSHVSNMSEQYQQADIYVMSSRFEGLPMVLLEAISSGLPLVSFDCKTGPKDIIDSSFGWLAKDGEITALADKMLTAFATFDSDLEYAKYSQAAITKCRSEFSIESIVNLWVKLLNNEK
ncbi:glycosyltransferase family 4 protein [Photobacterium sp. NCIMB 13483]|uniref:glycosyltransferase family 4 protein n=1 Tax=Photobacterium sp. NCIMB 13483 TaxID=2022103 RepID=UPI000D15CCF5|nr:glycosyltransferase family 4 protein [Photobacterium sp. NCIMB 13483]PST93549.1 glycosyltransferase family 4 protein [Photobacterium sp. NCIMB 13483]